MHPPKLIESGYRGRFAPSPTGPLHFGSLIAAIASYLDARHHQGSWLVRIDDLDAPRSDAGVSADILRDLESFGLHWDEGVVYQSTRTDLYDAALQRLEASEATFACACTRRSIPSGIYPGTCRDSIATGKQPRSIRLRTNQIPIGLQDVVLGTFFQNLEKEVGDFVVKRADHIFSYHLATVCDDAEQGITHVVRGADLLSSTPRQIYLQRQLDLPTPTYAHIPVALDHRNKKLSKQTRAAPVRNLPKRLALYTALSFLGQQPPIALREQEIDIQWTWARQHWQLDWVPRVSGRRALEIEER